MSAERLAERLEPRRLLSASLAPSLALPGPDNLGNLQSTTGLIEDSAGNVFGTIGSGGAGGKGTVFEVPAGSRTLTTLASFNGTNGNFPFNPVLDATGNLFGITASGGAGGAGTVFELPAGSNTVTTLASFNGVNGNGPNSLVADAGGNLYGTTLGGGTVSGGSAGTGSAGAGTVFEVAAGSGSITDLATFSSTDPSGNSPSALVIDAAGNLFGSNQDGGPGAGGTVFEIAAATHAIATVAAFTVGSATGELPHGLTIDAAGNVYGSTVGLGVGLDQAGVIFEVAAGSHAFSTLASLDGSAGFIVGRLLRDSAGNLFDTTTSFVVVELPVGSHTVSPLITYTPATGGVNQGLLLDATGSLYLAAVGGGAAGNSADFRSVPLSAAAQSPVSAAPVATHLLDLPSTSAVYTADSSNIFGFSVNGDANGGFNGKGTLFQVPVSTLALDAFSTFTGTNGTTPNSAVFDAAGNLYGATSSGGSGGKGTVFLVPPDNDIITTIANFNGTNGDTPNSILVDGNGQIFGTTGAGGSGGKGTVFEIDKTTHKLTTLATFDGTNGSDPDSLTIDAAGNLLGTTDAGGPGGHGTVFQVAADTNAFSTRAAFDGTNGDHPNSLVVDSAGNAYGNTLGGGAGSAGTVFEIPAGANAPVTLASFLGTDGFFPGRLVIDSAGNLFGTTEIGGPGNGGTVFSLPAPTNASSTSRTLATIASFGGATGTKPISLALDDAGNLFGTTLTRGLDANGNFLPGALFEVKHLIPSVTASVTAPDVTAPSATETVTVTFTDPAGVNPASITAAGLSVTSPGGSHLAVTAVSVNPSSGAPTSVTATYTVAAPGGQWSAADNGAYNITLPPGAALDPAGASNATTTGGFNVSVPLPNPDTGFGGGNAVGVDFAVEATLVQDDGKVLLAGHQGGANGTTVGVLERLNADGSVDTSFGNGGTVLDTATGDEAFYGLEVTLNGTVVVTGTSSGKLLLAGYTTSGAPDPAFGTAGRTTVAVPGATDATGYDVDAGRGGGTSTNLRTILLRVGLYGGGTITVAGSAGGAFLVDRFTVDGLPIPTFHGGTPLLFGSPGAGNVLGRVMVESDGSIVAAGSAAGSVVAARVTPAGNLDPAFGTGGVATVSALAAQSLDFGVFDRTVGLAVDLNNDIYVANHTPAGDFGVVRLTPAGTPDPAFGASVGGTPGLATTDFGGNDDVDVLMRLFDGTLVASGTTSGIAGAAGAVAAYTIDGAPDTAFVAGGKETFDTGLAGAGQTAAPSDLRAGVRPAAENLAAIFQVVAAGSPGGMVVGASRQATAGSTASSAIRKLKSSAGSGSTGATAGLSLAVTSTLPASAIAGAKIKGGKAVVALTSTTQSTLSGRFNVQLYLTQTGAAAGATPLGPALSKSLRLNPGAHKSLTVKVSAVPQVAAGPYFVLAVVTAPGTTSQATTSAAVVVVPAVVSLGLSAATATVAGGKVNLTLTLTGTGNQTAAGTATVSITSAGRALATVPVRVNLKPAVTKRYRVRFAAPAPGTYPLTITLAGLGQASPATGSATLVVA